MIEEDLTRVTDDNTASSLRSTMLRFLASLMDQYGDRGPDVNRHRLITPEMHRVPPILRSYVELSPDKHRKWYEPVVVSLGPYHYGNTELQPMEAVKRSMLGRFVMGVGGDSISKKCETVCDTFLNIVLATNVKQCYAAQPNFAYSEDEIFFPMLLVDVCFTAQLIHGLSDRKEAVHVLHEMTVYQSAAGKRDLFLLQNQIPFPVIKAMMMLKFSQGQIFEMVDHLICNAIGVSRPQQVGRLLGRRDEGEPELTDWMTWNDGREPIHILHALQMRLVDPMKLTPATLPKDVFHSYRSVMELKAAGIRFRPGRSGCFTDISFEDKFFTGTLTIPRMIVDDSTKPMLLNLAAFELRPDEPDPLGVTSYICLMDSLIDSAEDVKELRTNGIIVNMLGSDQQVADLFNEISGLLPSSPLAYAGVTSAIERHYKNTTKIWMSEWLHAHFSTPWTTIAFLFAVLSIALSITQTNFAVFPRNS